MKIHFYNSTPGQKPAERFLFIDDYALIKEGDQVTNSGRNFHIKQLSWIEDKTGQLKAVCTEVPIINQTI